MPGGFVGVDMFFVISGFVITSMLLREWSASGSVSFRRFYTRRFKRLIPALAIMVGCVVILSTLTPGLALSDLVARTGLGAMFFGANFVIAQGGDYFDPLTVINPLLNTWSLSLEEQFYLVFPSVLVVGWVLGRNSRSAMVPAKLIVSGVAVVSFAAALLKNQVGLVDTRMELLFGFYGPLGRAWEFAIGSLLALVLIGIKKYSQQAVQMLAWAGAVGLFASVFLIDESTPFPGPMTLLPVLSTAALIAAGGGRQSVVTAALSIRPLVAVGDCSYSLYLWHWPLIVFAALLYPDNAAILVSAAVFSVFPAIISYRYVERPFRKIRIVGGRRLVALIIIVVFPILSSLCVIFIASTVIPRVIGQHVSTSSHEIWEECFRPTLDISDSALRDEQCTFGARQSKDQIILLGDSQAAQLAEGLAIASDSYGVGLATGTSPSCPLMEMNADGFNLEGATVLGDSCHFNVQNNLSLLEDSEPSLVFIGMSPAYWGNEIQFRDRPIGDAIDAGQERNEFLSDALVKSITKLQEMHHQVVLVLPFYNFAGGAFGGSIECSMAYLALGLCDLRTDPEITMANTADLLAREQVREIAQVTNARTLDLAPLQCPYGICTQVDSFGPKYMDQTHISPEFSRALSSAFAGEIQNWLAER